MAGSRHENPSSSTGLLVGSSAASFAVGVALTALSFTLRPSSTDSEAQAASPSAAPAQAPDPPVPAALELAAPALPIQDLRTPVTNEVIDLRCDNPGAAELAAKSFHEAAFWLSCDGLARPEAELGELRKALRPVRPPPDPLEAAMQKDIQMKLAISQVVDINNAAVPLVAAARKGELGEPASTCFRPGYEAQASAIWYGLNRDNQGRLIPVISIGENGQFKDYPVPETTQGKAYALQMLKELALQGTTKGPEVEAWYSLVKSVELAAQQK